MQQNRKNYCLDVWWVTIPPADVLGGDAKKQFLICKGEVNGIMGFYQETQSGRSQAAKGSFSQSGHWPRPRSFVLWKFRGIWLTEDSLWVSLVSKQPEDICDGSFSQRPAGDLMVMMQSSTLYKKRSNNYGVKSWFLVVYRLTLCGARNQTGSVYFHTQQ